MRTAEIVTSFLEHEGKILILRRSDRVRTYRRLWAGVSGSMEPSEKPLEAAMREITEETGLARDEFTLVKEGGRLTTVDRELGVEWNIRVFLFSVKTPRIRTDWEHTEFAWIEPGELPGYETVPKLEESLRRVLEKV
jgi:8-oxo-dGTP pyrophosphatase MutT (NUDIX family)